MPTRTDPEIELPPDAATAADHRNPRRRRRDRDEEEPTPDVGHLVQPEPRHDLDKMILHPEVKTNIHAGLRALEIRADLDRIWNLSSIQPQQGRCILNFYGPPGTGKTRAALGIVHRVPGAFLLEEAILTLPNSHHLFQRLPRPPNALIAKDPFMW